jgi:plastocyanin
MVRRLLAATGSALLLALLLPIAPAAAGGGCHAGITQGEGDTIEMVDACFTPAILHVKPGTEVTWVNKDAFVHNVTANEWGHFDDLNQGDAFTATFSEPGVYPFACAYHPGMTGAIVVGSGMGAGSGENVVVESFSASSRETAQEEQPAAPVRAGAQTESGGGSSAVGWLAGGAIGLVLGAGIAIAARRRSAGGGSSS